MLLYKVRILNRLLKKTGAQGISLKEICDQISNLIYCNVYLLNITGRLIKFSRMKDTNDYEKVSPKDIKTFEEYNNIIINIEETKYNIQTEGSFEFLNNLVYGNKQKYTLITPVYRKRERVGTIVLVRENNSFNEEDVILAEYGALIIGMEMMRSKIIEQKKESNNISNLKQAIQALSYSEKEAISHVFHEFNGCEGLLVASKIAARAGLTRSIIVSALKKLESAGILKSHSLGAKGTHIKILNNIFIKQMNISS